LVAPELPKFLTFSWLEACFPTHLRCNERWVVLTLEWSDSYKSFHAALSTIPSASGVSLPSV
jgi:hypothetical protein